MSQSIIGRIWDRLANRYTQDAESDCCGPAIEEVSADETDESAGCGCE